MPHRCVFLHKCDDQSGCCKSDEQHCVASQQEVVYKQFFLMHAGKQRVVKLSLVNDTRCACRDVNNLPRAINGFYQLDQLQKEVLSKLQEQNRRERELIQELQALNNRTASPPSSMPTVLDTSIVHGEQPTDKAQQENEVPDKKMVSKKTVALAGTGKIRRTLFACDQWRRCAGPLTMQRLQEQPNSCFCACQPHDSICLQVVMGSKRLDDDELTCVRLSACHPPDCHVRSGSRLAVGFDPTSGFCPKVSLHRNSFLQ